MTHHARPTPRVDRQRRARHVRALHTTELPLAPEPSAISAAVAFLSSVAFPILTVPSGQTMPFWLALLAEMKPELGQWGQVVASEDIGAFEALGVTLADRCFGGGRPAVFLGASAAPGIKTLVAVWAAQWRRPLVLITGECASHAGRGTVQDSRGHYGASLVDLTDPLTRAGSNERGSFYVTDAKQARELLLAAPKLAVERQKAVHLNLPVDIQAAIFGENS